MADKKEKQNASSRRSITDILSNISSISKITNKNTYGLEKDLFDSQKMIDLMDTIKKNNEDSVKSSVEGSNYAYSRLNSFGLTGSNSKLNNAAKGKNGTKEPENIFDVISKNSSLFLELKQQIMMNNNYYNAIADYEILRRAIPQISRVINILINNIITPEVISSELFTIAHQIDTDLKPIDTDLRIKQKYELNTKLRTIVENYLILGAEYVTVVPYKAIVEAIKSSSFSSQLKTNMLREATLAPTGDNKTILNESTFIDALTDEMKKKFNDSKTKRTEMTKLNEDINKYLSSIKVYKSNKKLAYDEAFVEAAQTEEGFLFESSFDDFFKGSDDPITKKSSNGNAATNASDGMIANAIKEFEKINLTGCKIERLDPSRMYPLRIKDTVVAYIYLEHRRDDMIRFNLRQSMQNSFAFYKVGNQDYNDMNFKMLEDRMIREIGNRVLGSVSPKFLEANFKDMDIFYEFLRDHKIHSDNTDIIIMHPDDVIEFKRNDGSIMKNSVFYAKLYLLLLLNNILTKVRKGADRTLYYLDNGLDNDIEGSVMEAIEAIQQSQVRFSDLGTISGVIGSVGSTVDLFVPQSSDGNKPINPEVISGQQVDMDDEFLKWLIKSIVLSFNVPSVIVDQTEEIEFAKTLSMANLDIALSSALAQNEINEPLTKLIQRVMMYEFDLTKEEMESVTAMLIPSRSMLMQITSEQIGIARDLGTNMAEINIEDGDDATKHEFIKSFVRKYLTYDWTEIDEILTDIREKMVKNELKKKVDTASSGEGATDDSGGGDSGF